LYKNIIQKKFFRLLSRATARIEAPANLLY